MQHFLLFSVCSTDLDILFSGSFSHHIKIRNFCSFMFMDKISNRVVCVKCKHLMSFIRGNLLYAEITLEKFKNCNCMHALIKLILCILF